MPDDAPLFGLSMRSPPSNIMAEQSLLGALLHNNRAIDRCGRLRPEHFADPVNARFFGEIKQRIEAGRVVDAVSLKDFAGGAFFADSVGSGYLGQLLASMVGILNVAEYAETIRNDYVRRELIELGEQLVNGAFDGESPGALAMRIATQIDAAARDGWAANGATTLDSAMDSALEAMERARNGKTSGISTGFRDFDVRLGGLEPGLVYVLAGRPGMGKSSIGHQIALNVARAGIAVHEWSLEMSAVQLGRRSLATAAGVPIMALKNGRLNNDDADRIVRARKELAGLPLLIDDAGGQTAGEIAAKARSAKRKHGIGLIMVDHLNLVRAEEADAKHGGTLAVERASGTMLQMAKDCECPLLLLAQLNRGVEGRDDKRPALSDLRQAGAIEQDAYAVGFVYRPEYYLGGEPEPKSGEGPGKFDQRRQDWLDQRITLHGKAELIWAKIRDGEPGTDRLTFHGPTATFMGAETP